VKRKVWIFVGLLLLSHFCFLFADYETIRIEDYSYKDGLTTSCVYSTYQDSRGLLWVCSINGLYRFDGYNFRHISTLIKDAPVCETLSIAEDRDSNFWIGTSGKGILFYNTHTEKITTIRLNVNNNFKGYKISFFQEKIWVATDIGLLMISPEKEFNVEVPMQVRVLIPDPKNINSQTNILTTLFAIPGSKILWVGTNGALYAFDMGTQVFENMNTSPQNSIRWLSCYHSNIIAGSWDGGVFVVNIKTKKVENDAFINFINTIVSDKRVMTVFFDGQNRLWLATYGSGLYIFDNSKKGKFSYVNYRNNEKQKESLKSDIINQMFLDKSGKVWLSMNQPALSKLYFQTNNLNYITLSKPDNESKEIITMNQSTDKNFLWIATNGHGIYLFNPKNNSFTQFSDNPGSALKLINNEVNICYQDKSGNLWIVFRRLGLYVVPSIDAMKLYKGNYSSIAKPIDANILLSKDSRINSYITKFYEDSTGRLWIGAWGSLNVVELKPGFNTAKNTDQLLTESKVTCIYITDRKNEVSYPISPVLSILQRQKHQYWLGTQDAGILELDEISKNKFSGKLLSINNKLPSYNVKCVYKDIKQGIWIGTNSGLCYWNTKTNSLKTITERDGLASLNINNIIEDKRANIWVSTSYGISEINSKDFSINNFFFTEKEKLNQYIPNTSALSPDGHVYFSSNNALVTVNPDSIDNNSEIPPLFFTDVKIDNRTITPFEKFNGTCVIDAQINECKTISVPYNHTLSLEFAALDYLNPKDNLYKYKIGEKGDWVLLNSNQRSLSFPGMKPGEYILSIMLANSKKENQVRSIKINYLPPFWQSKTAYLVYFVLLLLLFLTYRRLIIQRVLQKSIIEKERYKRKKLEELDKMKSEFFSNISHEFRTPLSLIINPLEKLVKDDELSDKNKSKINLILKSSNRLLKLTNELMDFSKIEKKMLKPEFLQCEIVSLVKEVCRLFYNMADTMNIDFRVNSPFEQFELPVDRGMIEKVIFNLLSNAFKFTPVNGVVMVNISRTHADKKDCIKISVINTGEGITDANLEKVFDRYFQVNNVQNRNIEGTGIGLALVKSYVELHNGKVEVKSEPDVETCFDVFLPIFQADFKDFIKPGDTVTYTSVNDTITPGIGIHGSKPPMLYQLLLVEDDIDIRTYIADELSVDFKIVSAKDGNEGLKLANEIIPDLIITDLIMPGISGIELCKILKNQINTSHIPLIILSAKTTIESQIEGLEMGADVYMIKPFNLEHLKAQIISLIHFKESIYSRFLKETELIPKGAINNKYDEEFINKTVTFIETNLSNPDLNVDQLAHCVSLSKVQVYRKLKAISGLSIVEFIRTVRLKKASQLIIENKMNVSEIAMETGFSSPSYFTKCFHDHFGKTPSEFASNYGKK
jgi:signal transduction histidine kinase/ligand-binding sensor domain-containing protein/DNA-binding response OmpR family regulator